MAGLLRKIACVSVVLACISGAALGTLLAAGLYSVVPAKPGERCTVCGVPLGKDDVALIVRGRRVPLEKSMVDVFLADPEKYFAKKEPKSALFQEEMAAPIGVAQGGVSWGWFLLGSYLLVSLILAGLSGYRAVSRGLPPISYFFVGLFFNVPGFLYVLTRRSRVAEGVVPSGLVKVPTTLAPQTCRVCGNGNHPAATKCSGCGVALEPVSESDVARLH